MKSYIKFRNFTVEYKITFIDARVLFFTHELHLRSSDLLIQPIYQLVIPWTVNWHWKITGAWSPR